MMVEATPEAATERVPQKAAEKAAAGGALTVRPQVLLLSPAYRRARDSILRPHLRLTESRYFWEKWKPRLGADAAVLIMEVRDRCNRSLAHASGNGMGGMGYSAGQANGTTIDLPEGTTEGTTVSAVELAAACGFSRVTLWRLLQREDVRQFIRVEHNYVYDRRIGKKRRTVSTYHVLMEDPLVPEDEPRLAALLGGQASQGLNGTMFQTETEVVDNAPPTVQFETTESGSNGKPRNVQRTLVNKRLGGTPPVPMANGLRGGDPTRLGSLLGQGVLAGASPAPAAMPAGAAGSGARRERGASEPGPDLWQRFPEFAHHVEEAERLLQDRHSRGFYVTALKKLYPQHMPVWHRALMAAREQTNIRRSRGALFTRLLRTFAAEAGVAL